MEREKIVKMLSDLVQLDIDAWHAYGEAIEKIETQHGVRDKLDSFRGDHYRHVAELSAKIRDMGGEPPEFSRDFKGYLVGGFTAMRSITGVQGALKAMKSNEELTNKKYRKAVEQKGLPSDIKAILEGNYRDEQEHLHYIEDRLDFFVREKTEETGRSQRY